MPETNGEPIVDRNEKVLIITRPMYPGDARRHFVGSVQRSNDHALRVRGYAFVMGKTSFEKRETPRTRVFPMDNNIIIILLPSDADPKQFRYEAGEKGLVLTDGQDFLLDLHEFGSSF